MRTSNPALTASLPAPWLGRLLLVSLLVMLNLPALVTGVTGMDQYGFFTLEPVSAPPWPLALSLALSSAAAGAGYLAHLLLRRRAWFRGNRYEIYQRNAVVFGVPVGVAFLPAFFLTGYADKPLVLGVAGLMATALSLIAALNDRDMRLDPAMARLWFAVFSAFILVLVMLAVAGMLAMYFVKHSPSGGNFFWAWEFAWSDLGYPAQEFQQRRCDGLLSLGIAGSVYMAVALGGSLLGAALRHTRPRPRRERDDRPAPTEPDLTQPAEPLSAWLEAGDPLLEDQPGFLAAMNGQEVAITSSQYEDLLANKELLLPDTRLLVDKASGTAFAKSLGEWERISFRGRRNGPFLLLCVYARYPGRRFTSAELEVLLATDMPERERLNVSDFFAQLQKRAPLVPVRRDGVGTYIPEAVKVCFLDHQPPPLPEDDETAPTAEDEETISTPPGGPEEPPKPPPQS